MEVRLPPEKAEFAAAQVENGAYASIDEVILAGISALQAAQEADNECIQRGLADVDAGRCAPLDEAIARLTARAKA